MDIQFTSAAPRPSYTPPAASSAPSAPSALPAQIIEQAQTEVSQDAQRKAAVEQVAQQIASQSFPVSDVKFTIFKDSVTGQYITRFTSLRDGKVTYYPEVSLANYFQSLGDRSSFVDVKA